ncbi:TetR family transcriptional regulator [Nocardia farcinica]|uniref:TetR/AcrR family transcriptional regulator n=1 Tax=Nocardia farcinica TaxID=37329 RepID=UPI001893E738|nr:TetR family transcriptional regulator [Nocardia farcinica]MBF6255031.1 TetR family transcriptional regulator [Nocardia farcinica]MBF6265072.1 TetR family transcriptional regulator [Nocardia farcinica]MBF6282932.1 TetR family transcriptional regulator [Nocardia farcinica]MBF6307772.1 TetR family transcriptional regulator [Nocardia farcinica]MBF6390939.1 TetR family transcriptional regulator [Nocardia farcinica]
MGENDTDDGRRVRGQRRRAQIIEATLRIVHRDGAAGVTHRTVAKEAGITTSLTLYYFTTLDDLLVAALTSVTDAYTARIRQLIDTAEDPLDGLAHLIAESAGPGRERALAERELSTLAARRPALRPAARSWRDSVAELARTRTDDPDTVEAFVALCDGLCAAILLGERDADPVHIRALLGSALVRAQQRRT